MENLIRRRGLDLFDEFEDLAPDMSAKDWISILRQIAHQEESRLSSSGGSPLDNMARLRRFINGWSPDIEE